MDGAFLAATRVGIRHLRVDRRVFGDLLFAYHDAVFDEHIECTVAHAVDAVRGVTNLVPGPLVAVEVFPATVGVLRQQGVLDGLQAVERPSVVAADDACAHGTQALQKPPTFELEHMVLSLIHWGGSQARPGRCARACCGLLEKPFRSFDDMQRCRELDLLHATEQMLKRCVLNLAIQF